MLNPSTADAFKEDPTIRRCISFSRAWGYDALEIVNLFALRSPLPTSLNRAIADGVDPVGSENNAAIVDACSIASHVYAAWGAYPLADARARAVFDLPEFEPHRDRLFCLGCTFGGRPRHPLYVAAMTEPIKFRFPEFD